MTHPDAQPSSDAPLGTLPRRRAWPLYALIVAFAVWFVFLVFLAVRYPAVR